MSSVFVMDIPSVSVNDKPVEFDDSDAAQQHRADIVRKAKRDIRNKAFLLKHPDIATAFDLVKSNEITKEKPVEKPKPALVPEIKEESVKVPKPKPEPPVEPVAVATAVRAQPKPVKPEPPVEPVAVATAVRAQPEPKPEPKPDATATAVAAQPVKLSAPPIKNVSNPITIRASMDGKFF
jgi:hypothetical protein